LIGGFQNIFRIQELKKKILFTLAILIIYRVGVHVPTPGVDTEVLATFFERANILGLLDMFAGGAWRQFSVFALGIMPYISASIILELLTVVIPHLERLKKEGEAGRKKITQYARYGTVVLAVIQGFAIAVGLEKMSGPSGAMVVLDPGWSFRIMTVLTLTSGTAFIMWLGERITDRGIGNGISLIIFAGIISQFPGAVVKVFQLMRTGEMGPILILGLGVFAVAVVGFIVFCERGQRRIPIQYAKRVVGRRVYGGQNTHLPLKINPSGVIPPIFASAILVFPATIAQFIQVPFMEHVANLLSPGALLYNVLFVGFIFFFSYFYTAVTFNPVDLAENINKNGGSIPGIRAGKPTSQYIDRVLTRVTFGGAVYVSAVCVLPAILIGQFNVPFYFGGTGLLIVVGVALDTVGQIETHLLTRHYEGFMKGGMAGSLRSRA
jgi:preprotein translocase subunit SecY